MDPDMVRQQEEEEAASRRGALNGRASFTPPRHDPFVMRAEPRDIPVAPVPAPAPAPARRIDPPKRAPGWLAASRATFYCVLFGALGLIGGIMLGVKLGLVSWQSLGLGMLIGFGLGWRAAVAVLRKRYTTGFTRAYRASLVPALIVLICLVGGLAVILPFAGSSLDGVPTSQLLRPWLLSLTVGALAGFVLAVPKMHANLRG
jgi:Domain of unknown function (DUF4396)